MKTYIGTKIVNAQPEQRQGLDGYRVEYNDGYTSWSPKDVFERCYREMTKEEITAANRNSPRPRTM